MNNKELYDKDARIIANSDIDWNILVNKTILISGATGYVPQYFVHAFMKKNDMNNTNIKVIAFCRNKSKADDRFKDYYGRNDFELLIGDIFGSINIDTKIDYIIHGASPAGLVKSNINPVDTFKVNVFGADNLLQLAEKNHAEFILLSSVDVYGKGNGERFTEDKLETLDTLDIRNVYSYGKRAAENLAVCYMSKGVTVKIVRPTQIMGGGVELDDGRLHIDFISQMLSNNRIVLKGDGSPVRSFIYVTDAITAILLVMTKGLNGNAYNISNEALECSVLELAEIMAGQSDNHVEVAFNYATRNSDKEVLHAVSVVTAASTKIRELGFVPKISLEEACKKMINYYN